LKTVQYSIEDDDTDQIHYEAARQLRSAFGIGLFVAVTSSDSILEGSDEKSGPFGFCEDFGR